ncbi:MAG TPA: N-methyl-L-tryptophan oxidase [Streptosporangiaceae bacterium]
MTQQYRAIVIGCGAVGAATTYWLSRRLGEGVLALEQYQHGHSRGASEDHSRVIRHAYSRPEYTALTPAAFQSWNVAEQGTGLQLVFRTGGLIIAEDGSAGAAYVTAAADAMDAANLPFEQLTGLEVMRRWPQWRLGSQHIALRDPESGILDIRRATAAHIALARDRGATVLAGTEVTAITESAGGVTVTAAGQDYSAARVVLAGGAWNPVLLAMLGTHLPITLTEEQVTYFATPHVADFTPDRFGVYGYLADDGLYYGFPVYGEVATKIGIDGAGPVVTPDSRTYTPDEGRVRLVLAFLERYLPGAVGPELYTRTCCYDFPPDRDFIADYVPGSQRVLVCAGAGHAGKFAALLGRILADLALDGSTRFPVSAFSATRPALTGTAAAPSRVNSM